MNFNDKQSERDAANSKDLREDIEYESEEEEFDAMAPFEPIVSRLDITLDSPVLHLAVPAGITTQNPNVLSSSLPPIFGQKAVVAVACTDASTRLISFDLRPSRDSRDEQISTIERVKHTAISLQRNKASCQHPCRGLAMTWTSRRLSTSNLDFEGPEQDLEPQEGDQALFGGRRSSNGSAHSSVEMNSFELLIASHTSDVTGMLFIWRLPLSDNGALEGPSRELVYPIQTQFLPSPATTISFNTSAYPSRRHSHLLLSDARGFVRIYNPLPTGSLRTSRTIDRSLGTWLATFCAPFLEAASSPGFGQRTGIVDARWALNGKCILVLLQNGEWGIWDIEGVGPSVKSSNSRSAFSLAGRGITGGGITSFAIHSFLGDEFAIARSSAFSQDATNAGHTLESKKLAPMTPKTRKVKQEALFHGPAQPPKAAGLVRGSISVSSITDSPGGTQTDESVLILFGHALYSVPSLMTYWQRASVGRNARGVATVQSDTLYGPSITQLTALSTSGEIITSLSHFSNHHVTAASRSADLQNNILLSAEHRLIMLVPPKTAQTTSATFKALLQPTRGVLDNQATLRVDQDLLSKGKLDLGGMDRLLDGMANDPGTFNQREGDVFAPRGRKVGFATGP